MNYRSQPYIFNIIGGAITYYIESSLGVVFLENEETTILKAHIYMDSEEYDIEGELAYTWYLVDDEDTSILGYGKSITVSASRLGGKGVYFEAKEGTATQTSVLGKALLGYMVLGMGD